MSWLCCKGKSSKEEIEVNFAQRKSDTLNHKLISKCVKNSPSLFFISKNLSNETNQRQSNPDGSLLSKILSTFYIDKKTDCKYEDYKCHSSPALPGLNCDLIDDSIYISQRPISYLIYDFDLQIALIVNLQVPNENTECFTIKETFDQNSGFSYNSAQFSSKGICVQHVGWNEHSIPSSFEFILNIIKEMNLIIQINKNKVFVHSHIGMGRTTLLIVCYKLFNNDLSVQDALTQVQEVRKGSILNTSQLEYCVNFKHYIEQLNTLFPFSRQNINFYLKNQIALDMSCLNGFHNDNSNFIPKIIKVCLERILSIKDNLNIVKVEVYKALNGSYEINDSTNQEVMKANSLLTLTNCSIIEKSDNISLISEVLYCWLSTSINFCIEPSKLIKLYNRLQIENSAAKCGCQENNDMNPEGFHSNFSKDISFTKHNLFNTAEITLIKYISNFCAKLPPETMEEQLEYQFMIQKISLFLLGFSIDMLKEEGSKQYNIALNQMIELIHFFVAYESIDPSDVVKNYQQTRNQNASKRNSIEELNEIKLYLINSNFSLLKETEKERLYKIYKSLKKNFDPNEEKTLKSKLKKTKNAKGNVSFADTLNLNQNQ